MTKISKKTAYPIKNPVVGDFFVGTDSENNNKTVSFGFEYAANLINRINGSLIINYMFKTDVNIPLAVLTEGHFLSQDNNTDINTVTKLYVNKTNFQEDDLSDLFLFIKENTGDYYFKLQNSENLINAVYFKINSIVAYAEYFEFNIEIDKTNPSLTTLVDSKVYFFSFEIKSNTTKTSDLENDGADGIHPFITAEDLPEPIDISGKENKSDKGQADGYVPLNALVKIASTYLDIVNDLVTGGANSLLSAEQGKQLQLQVSAINSILFSDNVNLDTVQEIVDAIESLQGYLDTILVNDLTTGGTTKALTAEMGKTLKGLIDALTTIVNNLQADVTNIDARVAVLENFTPPPTTGLTGQAYAVWSGIGLKYFGTWPGYYIEGVFKSAGNGEITLNPTTSMTAGQKRYDLIILDVNGLNKITGVPDENPVLPTIDPDTQIIITNILLNAGDEEPSDQTSNREQIFDENTEWTVSKVGACTINANYAVNPYKGTKSLLVNAFGSGNEAVKFTASSTKDLLTYTHVCFRIKLLNFTNKDELKLRFEDNLGFVTSQVVVKRGLYNFTDNSSAYQLVVIPLSDFTIYRTDFTIFSIYKNSGNDRDFQLDDVFLAKSGSTSTVKQKTITSIVTDEGIVNAESPDDTIQIKGTNGAKTSATGKIITIDVSDAVQESKDYADAAISTETTRATTAETTLQTNIDAEETARIVADAATLTAANAYTDSKVVGVYTFKGNKADYAALIATTGMQVGDVYNVLSNEKNYAWTGTAWDDIGGTFDISGKEDISNKTDVITGNETSSSLYASIKGIIDFFTASKIRSILGITTLSGSNTGDQDLSALAPLASPTFTGVPIAPTAVVGTNTTQIATTAFVANGLATKQNSIGYTPANDANVVHLTGNETITGSKVFTGANTRFDIPLLLKKSGLSEYNQVSSYSGKLQFTENSGTQFNFSMGSDYFDFGIVSLDKVAKITNTLLSANRTYDLPNASGTIALTSDIPSSSSYIQNQASSPQSANMWISGSIRTNSGITVGKSDGSSSWTNYIGADGSNRWYSNTLAQDILSLAPTGAAAFASTVTASNGTLIGGTLTSGYIPKATGANSLGNSLISDNGTNVGIGTSSPSYKMTVSTTGDVVGLSLGETDVADSKNLNLGYFTDSNYGYIQAVHNDVAFRPISINPNGGNVGIGTSSPSVKLHLLASAENEIRLEESTNNAFISLYQQSLASYIIAGRTGGTPTHPLAIYTGGSERMRITSGGNVGIGTTSPSAKLQVIGNASGWGGWIENQEATGVGSGLVVTGGTNAGGFSLLVRKQDGTSTFAVSGNGNVGIGTTTDNGYKLNVNGSIAATSYTGSATLTGTPTAPTAAVGTNTTQIATTAFVQNAVSTGGTSSTNLAYTASPTNGIVTSDTGTDATLTLASGTNAGLLAPDDFTKLASAITGSLTTNYIPKASGTNSLTNSSISESGGFVTINSDTIITGSLDVSTITSSSSIRVGDTLGAASSENVGALRYREVGNNSYTDMCMRTGASTYEWVNIITHSW